MTESDAAPYPRSDPLRLDVDRLAQAWSDGWYAYRDDESNNYHLTPDEVLTAAREYAALASTPEEPR